MSVLSDVHQLFQQKCSSLDPTFQQMDGSKSRRKNPFFKENLSFHMKDSSVFPITNDIV